MAGGIVPLTDKRVEGFVKGRKGGKEAQTKLFDGGGLFLTVTPAGSPVWRIKYRMGKGTTAKERVYSVGIYPATTLAEARAEREKVKKWLKVGLDPVQQRLADGLRNETAATDTFDKATAEWLEVMKPGWTPGYYRSSSRALTRDVLPRLGKRPTRDITSSEVTKVIRAIKKRTGTNETAGKVLNHVRLIFEEEMTHGRITANPTPTAFAILNRGKKSTPHPAFLTFDLLGGVLRGADVAAISPQVRMAHRLIAFTAVRITNAIQAQWHEFDLDSDTPTWTIPRAQMKVRDKNFDHRVILGPTITAELKTWRAATGGKGYLFAPSYGTKPYISVEAIEKMLRVTLALRDKHSPHGWRAAFSTLTKGANKEWSDKAVELTLDHEHDTEVVRAYDRGERLEERVKLAYWWDAALVAAQYGTTPVAQVADAPTARTLNFSR